MENEITKTDENLKDKELRIINIMLLGKCQVGKSSITNRLQGKQLPIPYDATICDNYKFVLEEKTLLNLRDHNINNQYCLNIIDTGDYKLMNEFSTNIRDINYFIFTYAIDDLDSFNCIKTIIDKISEKGVCPKNSNSLIIGNKLDTKDDKRQIKKADAFNINYKKGIILQIEEISAKLNVDVDKIIEWILEKEVEKYTPKPKKSYDSCKCC